MTTNTPIDLKLFNVSESVPGLVETVGYYDIDIADNGDLELETGFNTNLLMSVFCERRAESYEVALPNMRRGWWGNETNDEVGFQIGSKLWLLDQARLTTGNINLAQQYAQQGLGWLITDGLAKGVSVAVSSQNLSTTPGITLDITINSESSVTEYKWYVVWSQTL